ncbi:MAG TPA: hypothetical protein VND64_20530 [Pirellulales bacterium]|nr:hypothetical protein [Pirellulales bacterium]
MYGAWAFGRVSLLGWLVFHIVSGGWARAQEDGEARDVDTTLVADVGTAPARFDKALAKITSVEFADTPLVEALASLGERHGVQILLDPKGLENAGIDAHSPVKLAVDGVRLESVLALVFRPLELDWKIENDLLLVTAKSEAENLLETKVYPVAELLAAADDRGFDVAVLKQVLTNNSHPETWDEMGGPGTIAALGEVLVINAERRVHAAIAALLAELRRAYSLPSNDAETVSPSLAAVRRALATHVTFESEQLTLGALIDAIREKSSVQVLLDEKAVAEAGASAESEVPTLRLAGVTLAAALTRFLQPMELTWIVRDDVLCVTSESEAESSVVTKVYPTGGLFGSAPGGTTQHARLKDVITTTIVPAGWDEVGGPGTISVAPQLLVISQTRVAHEAIDDLLSKLRATSKLAAAGTGRPPAEPVRQVVYRIVGVSSSDLVRAIKVLVEPNSWEQGKNGGRGMILVVRGDAAKAADAPDDKKPDDKKPDEKKPDEKKPDEKKPDAKDGKPDDKGRKPDGNEGKPAPKAAVRPLPPQPTLLIIRQTDEGHRQIVKLLQELGQGQPRVSLTGKAFF